MRRDCNRLLGRVGVGKSSLQTQPREAGFNLKTSIRRVMHHDPTYMYPCRARWLDPQLNQLLEPFGPILRTSLCSANTNACGTYTLWVTEFVFIAREYELLIDPNK